MNILSGKTILITAGPTYEKIDPVRFIGNYSTGKMGFALAEVCANAGAHVILIAGPVQLSISHPNIKRIDVESAKEMYEAATHHFPGADGAILCAAVADYRPVLRSDVKLKRLTDNLVIELQPTQDIAAALGKLKQPNQFMIGFALETTEEEKNALGKLQRKNLDFIVLNSLNDQQAGFGYDTNKITLLFKNGNKLAFPLKSKTEVASDIIHELQLMLANQE